MGVKINSSLRLEDLNLLEQAEFYRVLVNSIQDYAIYLLDPSGRVASWNLGAQKLKGYSADEIIGQHFSVFYTESDQKLARSEKNLQESRRFGRTEDEGWRVKKDGSRFWADVIITPLYDSDKKLIGYAKVTRDLTERKKYEDRLEEINRNLRSQHEKLESLNVAKDEFISLASHQLRTPATGVKQFLGIVLEGYAGDLTERQTEYLSRAYESNNRQIDLINDLLRVAQVDAGKIVLNFSQTDLAELINDVVSEQKQTFDSRSQKLKLNLPSEPLNINIDKVRFRMVLENLIDNASKYTKNGGEITVSVGISGSRISISIADNGVGIAASELDKLFTKFSRLSNEMSDLVGGSGLGLYWVEKIVSLHSGIISVESKEGEGTNFTVTLPNLNESNAHA